jgi:hypothetical protein
MVFYPPKNRKIYIYAIPKNRLSVFQTKNLSFKRKHEGVEMNEDFSRKTIIVLVILTVCISVLSSIAISVQIKQITGEGAKMAPEAGANQAGSVAKLTLTKIDNDDEVTAKLTLIKTQ